MNWKNVAHLIRVDMKSGRLIRGQRLTRYREKRLFTYLLYGGSLALGVIVGVLAGSIYNAVAGVASAGDLVLFHEALLGFFLSLPTLVLILSLVFTMMQQIQRSGVRASVQAPYWLPITWGEHTLASILANLLGFPLLSVIAIGSGVLVFSFFIGQVGFAVLTVLALLPSVFMASAITEIFRVLQVRFIGAVYKTTGRAAVWVRFVGSLLFFIVFYIVYFTLVTGTGAISFVQTLAQGQVSIWFVPFVWLGLTLYYLSGGALVQTFVFAVLSAAFILGLFYLALVFNRRFGLYEPPAIRVSRGVYAPRVGFLGRLGFSTVEAALIRKDLKAFTRRRELMYIFITPIVFVILPLMQTFGTTGSSQTPPEASALIFAIVSIFPSALMSMTMGNLMIGEEGPAVWRIYASPVSAKNLIKSKYAFMLFFSVIVAIITGFVGFVLLHPSVRAVSAAIIESILLAIALGTVSLSNGIRGADFSELPRPRMIRTVWGFINLITCLIAGVIIVSPLAAYEIVRIIPFLSVKPLIDLYSALIVSAVIAFIIAYIGYRLALRNARELLAKAEI
jgi:hypothetical protein